MSKIECGIPTEMKARDLSNLFHELDGCLRRRFAGQIQVIHQCGANIVIVTKETSSLTRSDLEAAVHAIIRPRVRF